MRISRQLYDDIVAHAEAEAPDECCGIVSSRGSEVAHVYRATNIEKSPLRFAIDGREQIRIHNEIESSGLEVGAIYHSHTRTEPYPSQTDLNFAERWPGVLWIIVGLAGPQPNVRTFEIHDGQVSETELQVV